MASIRSSMMMMMAVALQLLLLNCNMQAMAQSNVNCLSQPTSPTVAEAKSCIKYLTKLANKGTTCCREGTTGGCTTMCTAGIASVDICGEVGCTSCSNAVTALNTLLGHCSVAFDGVEHITGSIRDDTSGYFFQIRHVS